MIERPNFGGPAIKFVTVPPGILSKEWLEANFIIKDNPLLRMEQRAELDSYLHYGVMWMPENKKTRNKIIDCIGAIDAFNARDQQAKHDLGKKEAVLAKKRFIAERLVDQISFTVKVDGDRITQEEKGEVADAIEAVAESIRGNNAELVQKATDALFQSARKIWERIYEIPRNV